MADAREEQLVARVRRGDQAALAQLLEAYQHRLYNVCLRMVGNRDDAAELAQDAMLKIIQHIGDYNSAAALSTWMIRICMNLSISHLRKRRLRQTVSLDGNGRDDRDDQLAPLRSGLVDEREPQPLDRVQHNEMLDRVQAAMDSLDEEFKAVLVLRDLQEMDYSQMADVLSIPVGTVKSRLFRARLALREQVMKQQDTPLIRPAGQQVPHD